MEKPVVFPTTKINVAAETAIDSSDYLLLYSATVWGPCRGVDVDECPAIVFDDFLQQLT